MTWGLFCFKYLYLSTLGHPHPKYTPISVLIGCALRLFSPACFLEMDDWLDSVSCCFKTCLNEMSSTALVFSLSWICQFSRELLSFQYIFWWPTQTFWFELYLLGQERTNYVQTPDFVKLSEHYSKQWDTTIPHAVSSRTNTSVVTSLASDLKVTTFLSYPKAQRLLDGNYSY